MRRLIAATALAATCAAATAQVPPATPAGWQAAATRDIVAAYDITLANHAGVLDPHNPGFSASLKAARDHGLALAARVTDAHGYVAAVQGFTARIQDGHAGMRFKMDGSALAPHRWPGFVAAWRGDLYVHSAEEGAARQGERIVSCDGKSARQLMLENVFAFQGRPAEAGQWWSLAPWLFLDAHNPFVARPASCVFELAGQRIERKLDWRPMTAQARAWQENNLAPDTLPVGLTEPRPRLFWMAMPTFHPSDAERATYHAVYKQVETERARFLAADAVVIDLRNNGGGNSVWSGNFAAALWGGDRVMRRAQARSANERVWYRATPDNIAHFRMIADTFAAKKETAIAGWAAQREEGMRAALAAGKPYYIDNEDAPPPVPDPAADRPGDPPAFTRPVYVIVPGNCASACLDAVDVFKLFPNTKLIGAPSSADSTYMEVRSHDLPGGLARVIVPVKLYVNRPRGNGQFYEADIAVTALQWTTAEFLSVVERDLAR
ncbi:S41 family peptidase [Massilia sp. METH4]|uniref:S41 family peptidase n=1 Tax=Massilia sp. METH4 TaxID=3123041 RepID=UPI0030D5E279